MSASSPYVMIGDAAIRMGVSEHHLRKAMKRGVISPLRIGRYAMFALADLGEYRKALEAAGIVQSADREVVKTSSAH